MAEVLREEAAVTDSDTDRSSSRNLSKRWLILGVVLFLTVLMALVGYFARKKPSGRYSTELAVYVDIDGTWNSLDENGIPDGRYTLKLERNHIQIYTDTAVSQGAFVRRGEELAFSLDFVNESGQDVSSLGDFSSLRYDHDVSPQLVGILTGGGEVSFERE